MGVIDRLNQSMSKSSSAGPVAPSRHARQQTVEMGREIAPVVEAGQPVGERQRQALLVILLQPVLQALAPHLGAHPRDKLVAVERAQQIIGGAEIEPLGEARQLVGIGDQQDRHEPARFAGAQLGDDAQRVDLARAC